MPKGIILVTPRSLSKQPPPLLNRLIENGFEIKTPWPGRQPKEEELIQELPGCIGYLAGVETVSASVLEQADTLRVISRNGVGKDNIDLEAANRLGIRVRTTPGANAQGVAELTLSLLLNAARSISWSNAKMKQGSWERLKGWELSGKTLGVIGCGQIGKRVSKMAAMLGMRVLGFDVFHDPEMESIPGFAYSQLEDLLRSSDVITFHCPPGKKPILNDSSLQSVKSGAAVINTARADLVDDQAVLKAIKDGRISHYAVDVFSQEPPKLNELLTHERVTITPHIGGFTNESIQRATEGAVENLLQELTKGAL